MGIDVVVTMDHVLPMQQLGLLDRMLQTEWLMPDSPLRLAAGDGYCPTEHWYWDLLEPGMDACEQLRALGHAELNGPGCFRVIVYEHRVEIGNGARWGWYLQDEDLRGRMRAGMRRMACLLGSTAILYHADFVNIPTMYKGPTLSAALAWCRRRYGEPGDGYEVDLPAVGRSTFTDA